MNHLLLLPVDLTSTFCLHSHTASFALLTLNSSSSSSPLCLSLFRTDKGRGRQELDRLETRLRREQGSHTERDRASSMIHIHIATGLMHALPQPVAGWTNQKTTQDHRGSVSHGYNLSECPPWGVQWMVNKIDGMHRLTIQQPILLPPCLPFCQPSSPPSLLISSTMKQTLSFSPKYQPPWQAKWNRGIPLLLSNREAGVRVRSSR